MPPSLRTRVDNASVDNAGYDYHALILGPDPNNDERNIIRFEDGNEVGWSMLQPRDPNMGGASCTLDHVLEAPGCRAGN
jgi:hypothetical protein